MPNSNRKKRPWEEEKERLLKMTQEQRRQELVRDYIPLQDVPTWLTQYGDTPAEDDDQKINSLCGKVSLYKGDITQLEVDAIVNAANSTLLGGGGVDGCIHRASGPYLIAECRTLGGCPTGQAKITCGYQLPAKYVIHTVGPIARGQLSDGHKKDLERCYTSSLALAKEYKIRSIAFPCISTGIYGFPNEPAACIALNTAKEWLTENQDEIDLIIFCVFLEIDDKIYKKKLAEFFPKEVEEKNVHSPPSKKSKAKKEDGSTNNDASAMKDSSHDSVEDSNDVKDTANESDVSEDMTDQEPGDNMKPIAEESDEESPMKDPSHDSGDYYIANMSDDAGHSEEPEDYMKPIGGESGESSGDSEKPQHQHSADISDGESMKDVGGDRDISDDTEPGEGSGNIEKPQQQHSDISDGDSMNDVGGDRDQSQASDLSAVDYMKPLPELEKNKTKQEDIESSQEMSTDSQSQSVSMDTQELCSYTPLANKPLVEPDSESQVMEQSKPAQPEIQDDEMNSQNTVTSSDANSQFTGHIADAREGDKK